MPAALSESAIRKPVRPLPDKPAPAHADVAAIPRTVPIIIAGCLGMIYTQLVLCPAGIELIRHFGGNGFHVGIFGAIPTLMLFLQFFSAVIANHLTYRRWLWMSLSFVQRTILLPIALGPLCFPEVANAVWLWLFLGLAIANHGLIHFASPLWMSWMGDYLPRQGLSRFWGVRHLWMQWAGAAGLLFASMVLEAWHDDIRIAFAVLMILAAVAGVIDIAIFRGVSEPPVTKIPPTSIGRVLAEPFRNRDYRSFISFMCFWHFAAMVGAPFISLFLLSEVGMSLSHLTLLWVFCWVGGALCAGKIGQIAESFGHKPILVICTALKTTNMIALILVSRNPDVAFYVLIPVFLIDSILNAGFVVATNGFMLTQSPTGNRTMFIASGTALAGLVGGFTSIGCGTLLALFPDHTVIAGHRIGGFELLFLASTVLRLVAVPLALRIREPDAHGARYVVSQLIGASPLRMVRFPVGLFRNIDPGD